jgi:shikimate dehydrogenase
VTLPHKTNVMSWLDRVEPDAVAIGAVNTIFRDGAQWCGTNTDAPGFTRALIESGAALHGMRVTVLGAGGAARACVVGLARAGVATLTVCARRQQEASQLVHQLTPMAKASALQVCAWDEPALRHAFAHTDLLVQATSATLATQAQADIFARSLPLQVLPAHALVVDLVYRPRETSLLRLAKAQGNPTLDGLGMLLHQGALAFEHLTGRRAPLAEMRATHLQPLDAE